MAKTKQKFKLGSRYAVWSHNVPNHEWVVELVYTRVDHDETYWVGVLIPEEGDAYPPFCYLFTDDGEEHSDWNVDNMYLVREA